MSGFLDAHQHFWDPALRAPGWLRPGHALYRAFAPADLLAALGPTPVRSTIAVQADESLADTLDLLDIATQWPWVAGVVGWLDVRGDVPAQLATLRAHPCGDRLVGVRIALAGASGGWYRTGDAAVLGGLATLAEAGLALDVLADADTMWAVGDIAVRVPGLPVVLDHLGQPRPGAQSRWRTGLAETAAHELVYAKVSGLTTALPEPAERLAALRHAVAEFGPDRMMFGSDWPVSTLATGYQDTLVAYTEALAPTAMAAVFGGTARSVYSLSG